MQKPAPVLRRIRQKDERIFYAQYNLLFRAVAWKTMWKRWITSCKTVEIAPILAWKTRDSQIVGYTFGCKMLKKRSRFFGCQGGFQKNNTNWIIEFTKNFMFIFCADFHKKTGANGGNRL